MKSKLGKGLRLGAAVCALSAMSMLSSAAHADDFSATRSAKLVERAHQVRIEMGRGYATLRVRRTAFNGGDRHDQATYYIDVPDGGVATGLRTLGTLHGSPHWFDGDLLEAEEAARRYKELTGIGGYYPKDPALLSWRSQELLALQVFPCPPHAPKTVEYTLELPTEYHDGQYHLTLPVLGTKVLRATFTVRAANWRDAVFLRGQQWPRDKPFTYQGLEDLTLSLSPGRPALVDGTLASKGFAKGRAFSHTEVVAAPRLSEVPHGAYVVLVVDESRSLRHSAQEISAALDGTLAHLPDAHVQVVTFDRRARPRYPNFQPTYRVRADLESFQLTPGNGSAVDVALEQATALLKRVPRHAPRRIWLITDALTRASLTPELLRATTVSSGALVHVGVLSDHFARLVPDSEHAWNQATAPTGGLVWDLGADADRASEETRAIYEEWVRPKRLRDFTVQVQGIDAAALDTPSELLEGQGWTDLRFAAATPRWVKVEGRLWTHRVTQLITRDAAETKRWSALIFGTELVNDLSEPEMMVLAKYGGAVSPVTSYLAIEPGVRPSTEGLDELEGIGLGFGTGMGRLGGSSRTRAPRLPFDEVAFLEKKLSAAWKTCGGKPGEATVTVESTYAEVVDVPEVHVYADPTPTRIRCLQEAAWDLTLPAGFHQDHATYRVAL